MILTQNLLDALSVCAGGQLVADAGQYLGKDYDWVIKDLVSRGLMEDAGWLLQQKTSPFYAQSILAGPYEIGIHKVDTEEYDTLEEAAAGAAKLKAEFDAAHSYLFSVNARCLQDNGDVSVLPCDISLPVPTHAPANEYEAFDHESGQYVFFEHYADARTYALQKKAARELQTDMQFLIKREVREINGTATAWVIIE